MIRVEKDGAFWTLTLDRADKANALTAEMLEALADTVEAATGDARVIMLTGNGKVFSAGADLDAARAGLATSPLWERLSAAIRAFDGVSIAALNGTAAGGSLGMVLACDLRIAVPGASIFYPVMKLGFLPQPSDPARLSALVGPSRAARIFLAGERIPVEIAEGWGLVDRIVEPGALLPAAREMTAHAMAAPRDVLAQIKAMCRQE